MTNPEESDSSVLLLPGLLVIPADCGEVSGAGRAGVGVGRDAESGRVWEGRSRPASSMQSFMNKHSNWGHHR